MPTKPAAWPFANPGDMLAKARRDLGRLVAAERALNRDDAIDGAINECVAAWSVGDVVFRLGLTKRSKGDFQKYLRKVSPEIHLCRDIAEFYKHLELSRSDTTIDTDGVSVAYAVALAPVNFVFTTAPLNVEKVPFLSPPENNSAAHPDLEPDVAAIEVDENETPSAKPSRTLTVKIRLRDENKRPAAEVVEKAIIDWDMLLKSGGL